jgi:hypothetical protein
MTDMFMRAALTGAALVLFVGSAASQTTSTSSSSNVQVVTLESNLSTLNSSASTSDRRASGTSITTMRLERNASGRLIKATLLVRVESRTSQAETFNQLQIMGTGIPGFTVPFTAVQTVPDQTSVSTAQVEITDANSLAQIERLLQNPNQFTLSLGSGASANFLSGSLALSDGTLLSRSEMRLQAVGSLDRAIYRLLIRMAAANGTISQAERETMMQELTTLSQQLDQANGIVGTTGTSSGTGMGTGTGTGGTGTGTGGTGTGTGTGGTGTGTGGTGTGTGTGTGGTGTGTGTGTGGTGTGTGGTGTGGSN